jgi:hypothetical protein
MVFFIQRSLYHLFYLCIIDLHYLYAFNMLLFNVIDPGANNQRVNNKIYGYDYGEI